VDFHLILANAKSLVYEMAPGAAPL